MHEGATKEPIDCQVVLLSLSLGVYLIANTYQHISKWWTGSNSSACSPNGGPAHFSVDLLQSWVNRLAPDNPRPATEENDQALMLSTIKECKNLTNTLNTALTVFAALSAFDFSTSGESVHWAKKRWIIIRKDYVTLTTVGAIMLGVIWTTRLLVVASLSLGVAIRADDRIVRVAHKKDAKWTLQVANQFYSLATRAIHLLIPLCALAIRRIAPMIFALVLYVVIVFIVEGSFTPKAMPAVWVRRLGCLREHLPCLVVVCGACWSFIRYVQLTKDESKIDWGIYSPTWFKWTHPMISGVIIFGLLFLEILDMILDIVTNLLCNPTPGGCCTHDACLDAGNICCWHKRHSCLQEPRDIIWYEWLPRKTCSKWAEVHVDAHGRKKKGMDDTVRLFIDVNTWLAALLLSAAGAVFNFLRNMNDCPRLPLFITPIIHDRHSCHNAHFAMEAPFWTLLALMLVLSIYFIEGSRLAIFLNFLGASNDDTNIPHIFAQATSYYSAAVSHLYFVPLLAALVCTGFVGVLAVAVVLLGLWLAGHPKPEGLDCRNDQRRNCLRRNWQRLMCLCFGAGRVAGPAGGLNSDGSGDVNDETKHAPADPNNSMATC